MSRLCHWHPLNWDPNSSKDSWDLFFERPWWISQGPNRGCLKAPWESGSFRCTKTPSLTTCQKSKVKVQKTWENIMQKSTVQLLNIAHFGMPIHHYCILLLFFLLYGCLCFRSSVAVVRAFRIRDSTTVSTMRAVASISGKASAPARFHRWIPVHQAGQVFFPSTNHRVPENPLMNHYKHIGYLKIHWIILIHFVQTRILGLSPIFRCSATRFEEPRPLRSRWLARTYPSPGPVGLWNQSCRGFMPPYGDSDWSMMIIWIIFGLDDPKFMIVIREGLESISQGQLPNLQTAPLHPYHVGYGSVDLVPPEIRCSTTRRPVPCCLLCWALGVGLAHYISSSNGSYAKGCWEAQGKPGGLQPKKLGKSVFFFNQNDQVQ